MDAFLSSTLIVAIAEMGDKTQLLAILLATRFKRPLPIIMGILVATLANHALAALLGASVAGLLDAPWLRWTIIAGFVAMAAWTLVPDQIDDDAGGPSKNQWGPFIATTIAFFIVEIGDKTQVATIALGARFQDVMAVTAGTTLGMMIANVPAVLLGEALVRRVPMQAVRISAAVLFVILAAWAAAHELGWI